MEQKALARSREDKMIGGVCGGIARYFGIDSTLVRVITAVLILAGGLSLFVYILVWLIMPSADDPYR
jgi:phage shock protein PspC (stress-responsive transcriptional regulator)